MDMIAGKAEPDILSGMTLRRMRHKKDEHKRALNGLMGEHQWLMLKTQLEHIDELDALI